MAVRYNPNPARITEPLYKVEELEKSPLYTVLCGGKELTVYHTDSFDYVIPVVDDDSPLSFQVKVSKDFQRRFSVRPRPMFRLRFPAES